MTLRNHPGPAASPDRVEILRPVSPGVRSRRCPGSVAGGRASGRLVPHGPLAQLAEQRTFNPRVVGSIPTGPTARAFVLISTPEDQHSASTAAYCTSMPEPHLPPDDLGELLLDWARHLRGRNRAPRTIDSYLEVATAFRMYLVREVRSTLIGDIARRDVEDYLLDLSSRLPDRPPDKMISAATVARHYRSRQQLFRWLENEEEIQQTPFDKMSPP